MADIRYIITADAAGAIKAIETVRTEVQQAGKEAERAEPSFSKLWKQVAGGVTVAYGLTQGFKLLTSTFRSAISEAMEAEKVDRALLATMELTGRGGERTAAAFRKLASSLQSQTIYSDEVIKSAMTLLAQLTRLDQTGLERATKAAIGLSSVLGMDLNSAAMLVAKAIEGNVGALARYGFRIDETLPKNQALNKLLDEMAGLFERARAETETTAGAWAQLKNVISDWLQAQGELIITNPAVKAALKGLKEHVQDLNRAIELSRAKTSQYIVAVEDVTGFVQQWAYASAGISDTMAINWGMSTRLERKYQELGQSLSKLVEFVMQAGPEWEKERQAFLKLNPLIIQKGQALQQVAMELETVISLTQKYETVMMNLPKQAGRSYEAAARLMMGLPKWLSGIPNILVPLQQVGDGISGVGEKVLSLVPVVRQAGAEIQKNWYTTWDKLKAWATRRIDSVLTSASLLAFQLDSLFGTLARNEEIRIENEYKKRLAAIEKSISDEEKRNQAIMALESEYEIKRTEARRKGAKEAKLVNIFQALIDTAAAITKTMREWGMPFALPWIAMTAAVGAAQVAAIAAQPIPLAEGAVFDRPTKMLAETGRSYLVGEAGTEILLPEKKLRRILRSEIGAQKIEIRVPVVLQFGTQTIQREVVKTINAASRQGLVKIDPVYIGL